MRTTMSNDTARRFLTLGIGALAIICAFCIAALIA
jgi:LSD1 subclass zinc finger protein